MKRTINIIIEETTSKIKDFFTKHQLTEIYISDITPTSSVTIFNDPCDDNNSETLDRIDFNPETKELSFSSSSCWDSNYWLIEQLQVETIVDILDWLTENEEKIVEYYYSDNQQQERIITTVYGNMVIEGNYATSCNDENYFFTLPHGNMTNDEIKDFLRILWEEEHPDEEEATPIKVYITVSLEMRRKDGKQITEEDVDEIISQCDYNFTHEDVKFETEICGRNLL